MLSPSLRKAMSLVGWLVKIVRPMVGSVSCTPLEVQRTVDTCPSDLNAVRHPIAKNAREQCDFEVDEIECKWDNIAML